MTPDLTLGDTQSLIDACREKGLLRNEAAYVLATAWHETNRTMRPVREAYWLSEEWRMRNLRYWPFYGRGYVQITWETNYKRAGEAVGVDLLADLDAAMRPDVAAKIAVAGMVGGWFTGKRLSDYITLQKSDFVGARRIINGTDKAELIAGYAKAYDDALKAARYGEEPADVCPTCGRPL